MSQIGTKRDNTGFLPPAEADMILAERLVEHLPASRKQRVLKAESVYLYGTFFTHIRILMNRWIHGRSLYVDSKVMRKPNEWATAETISCNILPDNYPHDNPIWLPIEDKKILQALLGNAAERGEIGPMGLFVEKLAPFQTKEERIEATWFLPEDKVTILEDYIRRLKKVQFNFKRRNPSQCLLKEFKPYIKYDGRNFAKLSMTLWFLTTRKTFFEVKMDWNGVEDKVCYYFTEHKSRISDSLTRYIGRLESDLRSQRNVADRIERFYVKGVDEEGHPWTRQQGQEDFRLRMIKESEDMWDAALMEWKKWPQLLDVRKKVGALGMLNWLQL